MVHTSVRKKERETDHFHRTNMQREIVMQRLREQGFRITRQRRILLDVILNEECACCKEIYYKASSIDEGIGAATVYRMVNLLEEIGAIDRKSMYRISCGEQCENCAVSQTLQKAEHHECEFCGNQCGISSWTVGAEIGITISNDRNGCKILQKCEKRDRNILTNMLDVLQ